MSNFKAIIFFCQLVLFIHGTNSLPTGYDADVVDQLLSKPSNELFQVCGQEFNSLYRRMCPKPVNDEIGVKITSLNAEMRRLLRFLCKYENTPLRRNDFFSYYFSTPGILEPLCNYNTNFRIRKNNLRNTCCWSACSKDTIMKIC